MKIVEKPNFPKEIFNVEVKPELFVQAVRIVSANNHQGTQSTLTRSEVTGTRKKVYKQKGTGNARHGDRKAHIFVGGGIAFGPKPYKVDLKLPEKMRRLALNGALSLALKDSRIIVVSGMGESLGKTSGIASLLKEIGGKNWLIVTDGYQNNLYRAARNIEGVSVSLFSNLNTYEVLRAHKIVLMEEILESKSNKGNKNPTSPRLRGVNNKSSKGNKGSKGSNKDDLI